MRGARITSRLLLASCLALAVLAWAYPVQATTSYTFTYVGANPWTGTIQTWVVPPDVTAIYITARGGDGAGDTMPNADPRKYGGHGAVVTMTTPVAVTPGATLSIYVAGRGEPGRGNNAAGQGGWGFASGGQGGSGYAGGGGGGASAVVSDLDGLLIVAGGGGGAGAELGADGGSGAALGTAAGAAGFGTSPGGGGDAGNGGAAGAPGSTGDPATAGQSMAGGGDGGAGARASAGSRSYPFGGGGGGGYGGGGGGGGDPRTGTDFGGSGGGAGGSFSAVSATYAPSTLPWNPGDLRVGNPGEITITVYVPVPPPPPPVPASPPQDVAASAGDRGAIVSWAAPESTGSFPVTNYQVVSSPAGGTCLTSGLTCSVTGLRNGVDYTFTVRALTGAGWSSWSAPSATVTPIATTIMIEGSRAVVRGSPGIVVTGRTQGLAIGTRLIPWMRMAGDLEFTAGKVTLVVDGGQEVVWQRRTERTIEVQLRTLNGDVTSNSVVIRTR